MPPFNQAAMKNSITLLFVLLLSAQVLVAQSTYMMAGAGFLPNSTFKPNKCTSCSDNYPTEDWEETSMNPGTNFYFGLGKDLQLNEHWSLQGTWKIQHMEYPIVEKDYSLERNTSKDLISSRVDKYREQNTNLEFGFSSERAFTLMNREWGVFGGGYVRIKFNNWSRGHSTTTSYFDIVTAGVYDSITQDYHVKIVSKTKLDVPQINSTFGSWNSGENQDVIFGIQAGLSFPLLSSKEGQLKGQVLVSQDFDKYFYIRRYPYNTRPNFRQTAIMAGLVFTPEKVQRPKKRNPEKKPLSSGIYAGVTAQLFAISMNASWLSTQDIGLDVSVRRLKLFGGHHESAYVGPNYRLFNSRFFAKSGLERIWSVDHEGYDEDQLRVYVGGKYILPFSRRIGLQVDGGYYFRGFNLKKEYLLNHEAYPSLGVGIVFLPVGKGA